MLFLSRQRYKKKYKDTIFYKKKRTFAPSLRQKGEKNGYPLYTS
jgi:hypothetical protein